MALKLFLSDGRPAGGFIYKQPKMTEVSLRRRLFSIFVVVLVHME